MKNVVDTAKGEGLVEGMEKGIEKGMEKKSIEIARQMKTEGFSDEQIARLTGLTSNEIRDL